MVPARAQDELIQRVVYAAQKEDAEFTAKSLFLGGLPKVEGGMFTLYGVSRSGKVLTISVDPSYDDARLRRTSPTLMAPTTFDPESCSQKMSAIGRSFGCSEGLVASVP